MSKVWLAIKQYLGKLGLAGVGAMLAGGAIRAIEEILPLTDWHITPNQARVLFWLSVGVLIVGICLIIAAVRKHVRIEGKAGVVSKSEDLIDILTTMHRRLIDLQKEKAAHMNVGFEVFRKVLPTLAYRLDKVTEEEWSSFENDIRTKIHQAMPPKPYMPIRGRFNFKKWARLNAQWKERVYLRASLIARKARDELFNTKNWALTDGMKIAEWADGYGWGIKELRDDDSQWKGLYESIDNRLRIDDVLGGLIKDHIDVSHIYNNIALIVHISDRYKDDIYSLILYEALVGSPMSPEQVDAGLNEILGKIEKRLKEMTIVKTAIVYCCIGTNVYQVSVHNQGNDVDTVFVTLGTSGIIAGIEALMGASLPTIIQGGQNGTFISFKESGLPPGVNLAYHIHLRSNAEKPYKFTAWSETTKSNIPAEYIGRCPQWAGKGPEETAPPQAQS